MINYLWKFWIILIATKYPFSSMYTNVLLHISTYYKSGSTILADIWFSFNIFFCTTLKLNVLCQSYSVLRAVKMLLTNMFSNMYLKVTPLDIPCPTLLANKAFSSVMCCHMCLQMFSLWKSFTKYSAAK